jgi:uncharacterized protein YyaL (SSP411 family)
MNRLSSEKSPYLLQHKDNPIHWQAWGEEAFRLAREQGKPVFLSVGYSTCHWCHVMAHESFEDQEVAGALNKSFISIKVDREERPDVDDVYMKALQVLSGGGGWPMSVWLTPEGKPFFAGTYFPKYRFLQLLRRIEQLWTEERAPLLEDGDRLLETVRSLREGEEGDEANAADWEESLGRIVGHFQYVFDEAHGGFGKAPKFPPSMNLMVMMRQDYKSGLNQAEAMVTHTLNRMVRGGIYDQLRGGFHRYSVDEKWLVPHFEKMLYDQALITVALCEASRQYQQPELERAARETLDYVLRELTDAGGGFYCAQDADSLNPDKGHNEEGYFATYSYDELKSALSNEELSLVSRVYGVSPQGDFEGRSILHLQEGFEGTVKSEPAVAALLAKLEKLRAGRPLPHLDDKIIGAWNGWMIWAFALAGSTFGEERYVKAAARALSFCQENLWKAGKLSRFWRDGEARGAGTSEDYASLIHACLEVQQADGSDRWTTWALDLQNALDGMFWDTDESGYFVNDGLDPRLPLRPKDDYDGVTPSANSMAALNLERLYLLTGDVQFKHKAERLFATMFARFKQYPSSLPYLALAADLSVSNAKVAVISEAPWTADFVAKEVSKFHPYTFWVRAKSGWPIAKDKAKPGIYVCEEGRCLAPAASPEEAVKQLSR